VRAGQLNKFSKTFPTSNEKTL